MVSKFEDHCWQDFVDPQALEIYSAYERETYVGKRPALLAIDLYKLAFQGGALPVNELIKTYPSSCGENAWNAVPHLKKLFSASRQADIPVIYSTTEARKEANVASAYATNRQKIERSDEVWEIQDDFAPEPGDLIVYKQRASAFYGTPLIAQLNQMDVDSVIVCGESTSGCVRATVLDAYSNGIHVTIAEEGCFDRYMDTHKMNLFDMHHKYADVMHVDEIVEELNRRHNQR